MGESEEVSPEKNTVTPDNWSKMTEDEKINWIEENLEEDR